MKYHVTLYPTIAVRFLPIEAPDPETAVKLAKELYYFCEPTVEAGAGLYPNVEWVEDAGGPFDLPIVDEIGGDQNVL